MSLLSHQSPLMLNAELIQLLLTNQAAANANLNLLNPVNPLLGVNPLIGSFPFTTTTPATFQCLPPLPNIGPIPPIPFTPLIPTPLPILTYPPQAIKEEEPTIKTEQPDPTPLEPEIPFEMGSIPISTYYPTHFMCGTQLRMVNGEIKKVENLSSDDFLKCAGEPDGVIVNASTVKSIRFNAGSVSIVFETGSERLKIPLKCQIEQPFFVLGKGWCSCNPRKSGENYGLDCETLMTGDVCIVLTKEEDETTECAVDIVTAERDLELFNQRAALREKLVDVYYEHVSGRVSAPPEGIWAHASVSSRLRRISEC
ncbi:hypothetical protein L5515_001837 [Caenorhabditis briggsae]|uniref:AXH domain-containing protein n=1 Tax=Caenorhabditis briggsae TaxID=6238 RepID=A0AAE9J3G6_CAEBR|nr:hypothetical protein L5515_001837 [Caenorhabditis briggsae]